LEYGVADTDSLDDPVSSDASDDALATIESADPDHRIDTSTYIQAELFDSGCTKHITPYRDDLIDFVQTPPKSFRAANKQSFSATGIGKLIVDLPNSTRSSKLELDDVQYSSQVAYSACKSG